jgi:N-glycosylase/DNA lyase
MTGPTMRRCSGRLLSRDFKRQAVSSSVLASSGSEGSSMLPFASSSKRPLMNSHETPQRPRKRPLGGTSPAPHAAAVTPLPEDSSAIPDWIKSDSLPQSIFHADDEYSDLNVPPAELRASATLTTGQCFHWRVVATSTVSSNAPAILASPRASAWGTHNAMEWIGTLRVSTTGDSIVVMIRETPQTVLYRTLYAPPNADVKSFLYAYFQLPNPPARPTSFMASSERVSLAELYQEWSSQCDRLRRVAKCIPGVRIIDQDPWECLVSFLCSSNNNIPRITKMLNAIRRRYGDPVVQLSRDDLADGKHIVGADPPDHDPHGCVTFYSFPSLVQLNEQATETDLRTHCGMGYRAKYLMETMKTLTELGGEKYLHDLRNINDPIVVQEKLIQFCGVGRKVADCIALFSLKCHNAVPVDVHVWNIARRDYGADALIQASKSLTPTIYQQIGGLFRSRFPTRAGWAHSLLFVAELPSFRAVLPPDLVEEMDQVRTAKRI